MSQNYDWRHPDKTCKDRHIRNYIERFVGFSVRVWLHTHDVLSCRITPAGSYVPPNMQIVDPAPRPREAFPCRFSRLLDGVESALLLGLHDLVELKEYVSQLLTLYLTAYGRDLGGRVDLKDIIPRVSSRFLGRAFGAVMFLAMILFCDNAGLRSLTQTTASSQMMVCLWYHLAFLFGSLPGYRISLWSTGILDQSLHT